MRAYGVDLHPHYQDGFKRTDEDFAIFKVSEGVHEYPDAVEYALSFDFPVAGAYHYFRSGYTAKEQTGPFLDAAAQIDADLLAIDFEDTIETFTLKDVQHLKTMHDLCIETGKRVLIYAGRYDIQKYLFQNEFDWVRRKPEYYPLWIAQWPYDVGSWPAENYMEVASNEEKWQPVLPAGMTVWKIWQFYVTGHDHDVFNGTLEEMKEWVGIDQDEPEPTPEPPSEDCEDLRVAAEGVVAAAEKLEDVLG